MKLIVSLTTIIFTFILLQGCASTGANSSSDDSAVSSSYVSQPMPLQNQDYMYRSPPPQVTRALIGR